jgi:hypothetical protein
MPTPIFKISGNCLIPKPFPEIVFLSVPNRSLSGTGGNPLGDCHFSFSCIFRRNRHPGVATIGEGIICRKADKSKPNVGSGIRFSEKIIVPESVGRERSRRSAYRGWVRDRSLVAYERRAVAALT